MSDAPIVPDPDGDGDDDTKEQTEPHQGPLTAEQVAALIPKQVG